MSVQFVKGDLFDSKAQTLAHGCNCQGKMGAGIALGFKRRYPSMFKEYKRLCHSGLFVPGSYFLFKYSSPWILNLATQDTKRGARIEFVEHCLVKLSENYHDEGITSIAMPRIGAGLGGLPWHAVKKLIISILDPLPIEILVYEKHGTKRDWG